MHILPKHYYLKRTLFDDKAVEIFLRKKADFGGKKVKKGHAQTLLSSDCKNFAFGRPELAVT